MNAVTVLDGGMGKELRRIGAPFRQPEWSSLALTEAPEFVAQAHRNFVDAGADVIVTNNYAVVPYHHPAGLTVDRLRTLTATAGRIAREVADASGRDVKVAGSLPPLFGSYEPEQFDPVEGAPLYAEIVRALDPYVDVWLGETLSCTIEMTVQAQAIAHRASGQPVWMSFCLPDHWPDDQVTLHSGEAPHDIVRGSLDAAVDVEALLFNCSLPEQTGPALSALRDALDAAGARCRTGGYANAFPTARDDGYAANEVLFERRDELTAERYADDVAGWVADGASIVGGCCDMYPEHIAALAERFR